MKIFIVHEDIYNAGNPYIYTLVEGICKLSPKIEFGFGRDEFWSEDIFSYDIIHFHWPQAFMAGDTHSFEELENRLKELHSRGKKIIATCHDLRPHYNQCAAFGDCMVSVYQSSDAILHLGEYSKSLFEKQYPQSMHFLVPHHIYDTVYTDIPNRDQACSWLNLDPQKKYILCFGTFRADEERELVSSIARSFKSYEILAPGFMDIKQGRRLSFIPNKTEIKAFLYRHWFHIHMTGRTWNSVSDDDLPYYYAVSDLCFIQRKKILNSGNAILPMLFDKVVVGPDTGNVGPLLRSMGYPVFNINEKESIYNALKKGMELQIMGEAVRKHDEFMNLYSTAAISNCLLCVYKEILGH